MCAPRLLDPVSPLSPGAAPSVSSHVGSQPLTVGRSPSDMGTTPNDVDLATQLLLDHASLHGLEGTLRMGTGRYGRGLFATEPAQPDDRLLLVPECLLITSEQAFEEPSLQSLLRSPEATCMGLTNRPELLLMLFVVADRARCDGYCEESLWFPSSVAPVIEAGDEEELHREFVALLHDAPRHTDGCLAEPASALEWLDAIGSLRLSHERAGRLLAICDLKGAPSLDEFLECTGVLEAAAAAVAARRPLPERPSRSPFYATVPGAYPELPMHWPDSTLDALLPRARGAFARAQRAERDVLVALLRAHAPGLWAAASRAWEEHARWADPVSWAHATVRSRALGLCIGRRQVASLAPLADLANHAGVACVNANWSYDAACNAFVVHASRPVGGSEEIFYTYGQKSNGDLLMHYGFTLDKNVGADGEPLDDVLLRLDRTALAVTTGESPDEPPDEPPPESRPEPPPSKLGENVCVQVRPSRHGGVRHAIALLRVLVLEQQQRLEQERLEHQQHAQATTPSPNSSAAQADESLHFEFVAPEDRQQSSGILVPLGSSAPGFGAPPLSQDNELTALTTLKRCAAAALTELRSWIDDQHDADVPADAAWVRAAQVVCAGELHALEWLVDACESSLEAQRGRD